MCIAPNAKCQRVLALALWLVSCYYLILLFYFTYTSYYFMYLHYFNLLVNSLIVFYFFIWRKLKKLTSFAWTSVITTKNIIQISVLCSFYPQIRQRHRALVKGAVKVHSGIMLFFDYTPYSLECNKPAFYKPTGMTPRLAVTYVT